METFVGDIVEMSFLTGIDLTTYELYIKYRKPDGNVGIWDADIHPTDNTIAQYTTAETDLDVSGVWRLQVYAEGGTYRGHGRICELDVLDPLTAQDDLTTVAPTTVVPTTI